MIKIKSIFNTILYIILFVGAQAISLIGISYYKFFTDKDFANKFIDLFANINDYEKLTLEYSTLLSDFMLISLIISNLFIIIFIIIRRLIKRPNDNMFRPLTIKFVIKYFFLGLLLNIGISVLLQILSFILPSSLSQDLFSDYNSNINLIFEGNAFLMVLSAGVLAPIAEELIFRYAIFRNLSNINTTFALITQALLFGILHGNIIQGSYAFILGIVFGYVTIKQKNNLCSIIMHIAINLSSCLIVIFLT